MKQYKRLTNNNHNEYDPEYDFCCSCKYFGEPNGCNRPNGTCDNYDRFLETYNRLSELEDKIENGTLIQLPCVRKVKFAGFDYVEAVYIQRNGTIGECICLNENEAEKILEKMKNG